MIANQTRSTVTETAASSGVPKGFRRLKWDEVVTSGDYLVDEKRGFVPWQGPGGFRADTFLKPIYRRGKARSSRAAGNAA
ncbi:MAG TPA: hypothetical protein VNN22_01635 [Verrucomicrobiae bacterium]|nr:hypothetical protein [Verrucomicrobiae bacterium]